MALLLAVLLPFLLVACGDDREWPRMIAMMGGEDAELPAGIPAAELPDPDSRGARLVAEYCSQCHGIPSPRRHAAEDWEATTRRMFRRMAHMEGMGGMMGRMGRGRRMAIEAPTPAEERAIVAYLRDHAMRPAAEEALPAGEGREAFVRACSRCHALPDPRQRAPEEWPAVVDRMRGHMERMEVEEISDAEAGAIIRYLRRAASGAAG